ncbi:MAG: hypothetical protein NTX86_02350 [Candidatus Dependentiae bacterium]|nr:hypothetical protein [Candidatus Dependentiae bacterium]
MMHKQEQRGSEVKSICPNDDMKQLSGFFLVLFKVFLRTRQKDTEGLKGQPSFDTHK